MEKNSLGTGINKKKSGAVTTLPKDSGEATKARGKSEKTAAPKKPGKAERKATKKNDKKKRKGAKKALRHAVQREVKEKCGKLAQSLVNQTEQGNMHSAAMVMGLMEKKKKKDGEGETEAGGPSLADQLSGPSWTELQEAKRIVAEREAKTEAA